MATITAAAPRLGVRAACAALGVPRATYYRARAPVHGPRRPRVVPRALSTAERARVLAVLHEDRFLDQAPREVWATLLDEGTYLCSLRTMQRVLAGAGEARERRDQCRHPSYARPERLATRPNELWSWDITKLRGPTPGTSFQLYTVLDVFSRYVVGWMLAPCESAVLARKLFRETCARQGVAPGQLTIHADRGSSMRSRPLALLFADLAITQTHSRPHVSNDNAYSEAQFKTLKYRPDYPDRFGSLEDARAWCTRFFAWYNADHHHAGLALHTPHDVHHGRATARQQTRAVTLAAAHAAHPERFVRGAPVPCALPTAVWINKPVVSFDAKIAVGAEEVTGH